MKWLSISIYIVISDFSLVAKLTKEPTLRKAKEGEESKPPSPVSRSGIKQAMRVKCNTVISLQKKRYSIIIIPFLRCIIVRTGKHYLELCTRPFEKKRTECFLIQNYGKKCLLIKNSKCFWSSRSIIVRV